MRIVIDTVKRAMRTMWSFEPVSSDNFHAYHMRSYR